MGRRIKSFILGFTNAFTPIDYSDSLKYGDLSQKISKKMEDNRRLTYGQINETTASIATKKPQQAY